MKRVLQVNASYSQGGAAKVARSLHQALNSTMEYCSLFAYGHGLESDPTCKKIAFNSEMKVNAAITRFTGFHGYGSPHATQRLLGLIDELDVDVVHFHNVHGYYLNADIVSAVVRTGRKTVWTLHDGWALTGRCALVGSCEEWRGGCRRCPYLDRYPRTCIDTTRYGWTIKDRRLRELAGKATIISPSQWLAGLVASRPEAPSVSVIPNAVDTEAFQPRGKEDARLKLGCDPLKKTILFMAANLKDPLKGLKHFIDAIRGMKKSDITVITIGEAGSDMGLDGVETRNLGYVSDPESLSCAYSAADSYCTTSLDDNFPLTVLEAMACGTPTVAYNVGGIPEQIGDGCGFVVDKGDRVSLAQCLEEVTGNSEVRARMSRRCREKAVAEYSLAPFLARYIAAYEQAE